MHAVGDDVGVPMVSSDAAGEPDWQVPDFDVQSYFERRSGACVVIPVLNEGERIRSLLRKMAALGQPQRHDVVLVDGGSTDGSLDEELLRELGVRALLVKTGPGKLSAQLRCGYAWALREGYEGIVTIDGNDKDDPDPIDRFVERLADGVDFVQASRYLPGGAEERVPPLRTIAIRLIHAPVLSLSSGFRWTDSTQGFRAYSARMLRDPRVAPFRDVFSVYELLGYMSHCAPRLGFRCEEQPTARRYPEGEVPTKISAVRGNLRLLRTLFLAASGGYDSPAIPKLRLRSMGPVWTRSFGVFFLLFALLFVAVDVVKPNALTIYPDLTVENSILFKEKYGLFAEMGLPRFGNSPEKMYPSQLVGQSVFWSLLTPGPDSVKGVMSVARKANALLSAGVCAGLVVLVLSASGFVPAFLVGLSLLPVAIMAPSAYWQFGLLQAHFLVALTCLVLPRSMWAWFLIPFVLTLSKSVAGYEFISTSVMLLGTGAAFAFGAGFTRLPATLRRLALVALGGVLGLAVVLALHHGLMALHLGPDYSPEVMLERVRVRAAGGGGSGDMAEIMIVTGLLLYEPALAMARMVAHVALVPSLFLAATVFASVVHPSSAVSAVVSSPPLRPLLAAMVYAFLAGSTWPLVMPAHSVAHTHLVLMCFYAGFVPLSAWCFGVWGARVVAGST